MRSRTASSVIHNSAREARKLQCRWYRTGHIATDNKNTSAAEGGDQQLRSDCLGNELEKQEEHLHGGQAGNGLGEQLPRLISHGVQNFGSNPLVAAGGTVCLHHRDSLCLWHRMN